MVQRKNSPRFFVNRLISLVSSGASMVSFSLENTGGGKNHNRHDVKPFALFWSYWIMGRAV